MSDDVGVHEAIALVIGELPSIGKDSQMTEGPARYSYRSVEAIKAAVKPLLAKYGVHYAAHEMTVTDSEFTVRSGAVWQRCRIMVRWRVYGLDGSWIEHVTRGEGTDNGDKASLKAMTSAEKYLLVQVFAIAEGGDDPDHHRPDEAVEPTVVEPETWERWVKAEVVAAVNGDRDLAREFWTAHRPHPPAGGWTEDAGRRVADQARAWLANRDPAQGSLEPATEPDGPSAVPDGESPVDEPVGADPGKATVAELRAMLRDAGLPTTGTAAELRDRLAGAGGS